MCITYSSDVYKYINNIEMIGSKEERIVMLALYISSNGLLCKIGNPYINIPASTFCAYLQNLYRL